VLTNPTASWTAVTESAKSPLWLGQRAKSPSNKHARRTLQTQKRQPLLHLLSPHSKTWRQFIRFHNAWRFSGSDHPPALAGCVAETPDVVGYLGSRDGALLDRGS